VSIAEREVKTRFPVRIKRLERPRKEKWCQMNPSRSRSENRTWIIVLFICFGFIGTAAADKASDEGNKERIYRMYAEYKKDFPTVEDISPERAMQLWRQGRAVFLDTRKPEETAVSMLPGAITEQQFLTKPQQYSDKTVIGYCTISYRSGLFARDMAQKGIRIVNLQGGILAWIHAGGPVYDAQGRITQRVHVYGNRWDLAPERYETITFGLWGIF
jgi:sodium/bile acid cotransporter 7